MKLSLQRKLKSWITNPNKLSFCKSILRYDNSGKHALYRLKSLSYIDYFNLIIMFIFMFSFLMICVTSFQKFSSVHFAFSGKVFDQGIYGKPCFI